MNYNDTIILEKDYSTITFDQLSKHLNLDEDLVNVEFLEALINASIDWVETRINSYITPTILEYSVYEFTGTSIQLEHKGFNTISSLKVNDVEYTDYKIIRKYSSTYIIFNTAISNATVIISYLAGNKPAFNQIQAVIITAADMYDVDRSNYSAGLVNNKTVMRLLNLE